MKTLLRVAALGLSCLALPAQSAPLTALETLQQFNLITSGDVQSYSHVDGRSFIGGSLTGGDFMLRGSGVPASAHAGLTVVGNAHNIRVNGGGVAVGGNLSAGNINQGAAYVGGNAQHSNFNGGPAYIGGEVVSSNLNGGRTDTPPFALPSAFDPSSVMRDLAGQLSRLDDTGGRIDLTHGKATFHASAATNGVAVFDLGSNSTLFSLNEFAFDLGDADLVIFNVGGAEFDFGINFLGGSAHSIAQRVIWNFYEADAIRIEREFGGTVLAPFAHLTHFNNIEGSVAVHSLLQYGEIHLQPINAPHLPDPSTELRVPEPTAGALLGLALLLGGIASRRHLRLHR